jgi:hypothetical protein
MDPVTEVSASESDGVAVVSTPLLRIHRYDSGAAPPAIVTNVALAPDFTITDEGCCVMTGAVGSAMTWSVHAALQSESPKEVLTLQRNKELSSVDKTPVRRSVSVVPAGAPIAEPFFVH